MKYSTKIIQKSTKTTPFAGIFFIEDYFDRYKIGELCDEVLGKRAKQAEYSYADIIKSLWMIAFTGGQALEVINNQTGSVLKIRPGAHVPNADTLGYALKKLADKDFDATYSYKQCFGYFPGVAFINGLPFNIENRDGNMNVKLNQAEFLEGRTVARSRAEL